MAEIDAPYEPAQRLTRRSRAFVFPAHAPLPVARRANRASYRFREAAAIFAIFRRLAW